ncbi:hypothetical protein TBR22_A03710 [Luteitalea sp. TBR-22]|uniref:sensor histidine kinase n=1 Tax=Luteitalea sp. TBR-22 TaxID=2802971 RepID=UPI001AF6319C|nr:ATP-binding protein [Luteitalea sp. TBR-22]BCS31171.1 hypothetical protein TBR22_A03710 [Luteitalea sp. TBR-22]
MTAVFLVAATVVERAEAQPSEPPTTPRTVVAIHIHTEGGLGNEMFDAAIRDALGQRPDLGVDYFQEYLTVFRLGSHDASEALRDSIRRKYKGRRIDVVLANGTPAREFVLRHRDDLFPGTPILFSGVGAPPDEERRRGGGISGVDIGGGFRESLELALRLHPETRRVYVLVGAMDGRYVNMVRPALEPMADRVQISYLADLSVPDLIAAVRRVPRDGLILLVEYRQDSPGPFLTPEQIGRLIADASPVPVYGVLESHVGLGLVGGVVRPYRGAGPQIARMMTRVLDGTRVETIPIERLGFVPLFDWRQLQRWRIAESSLPEGAVVRFREPTAWERYRWPIVGTATLVTVQMATIAGLLVHRNRRRRAESALRRSEERYALATSAGGVGVWDLDVATGQLYVDGGLATALGYGPEGLRTTVEEWMRFIHADDLPRVRSRSRDVVEGRAPALEIEHRLRHRDGSQRWFLMRGSAVGEAGRPERIIGTNTDITARKESEAHVQRLQAELSRVSRISALGAFAASIAHEVRQPLTAIISSAAAAGRFLAQGAIDDAHEALASVLDAGRHADAVIERNRALFSTHTVSRDLVDLNAVVGDAMVLANGRLAAAQVAISLTLQPDLPPVEGDAIELQQVLLNLVANAADALEGLPPARRRLAIITWHAPPGEVRVAVRDTGIGLAHVDRTRLFSLSYTTKPSGTGVGLSISRTIIEAHGGTIHAEQNREGGATFTFHLPIPDVESRRRTGRWSETDHEVAVEHGAAGADHQGQRERADR